LAVVAIEQFTFNSLKWFFHPNGRDAQRISSSSRRRSGNPARASFAKWPLSPSQRVSGGMCRPDDTCALQTETIRRYRTVRFTPLLTVPVPV
jgi:hypothetical protein